MLSSRSLAPTNSLLCSQLGIPFYKEFDDFFESGSEVILLCTSILSTVDLLSSIPAANLRKPRLFVDVLSVKEYPRELLLKALPEEADVLCTHPMFGPDSGRDGWQDLPLVYDRVRVRNHILCDNYLGIFIAEGCRMVEMSCEDHDRMAAKTQFHWKHAWRSSILGWPNSQRRGVAPGGCGVAFSGMRRPRGREANAMTAHPSTVASCGLSYAEHPMTWHQGLD